MDFETVNPDDLLVNPALEPQEDLERTRRMEAALSGEMEVNAAALPLGLLVPLGWYQVRSRDTPFRASSIFKRPIPHEPHAPNPYSG